MTQRDGTLTPFERLLQIFTKVRPGEGPAVAWFALYAFLLLFAYFIVRTLREAFMLSESTPEHKTYVTAVNAFLLIFLVPAYSALRRRIDGAPLMRAITWVFIASALVFCMLAATRARIGDAFYIWASILGLAVIGHFWALAADSFNMKSGQRLFPVILIGGAVGALLGGLFAGRAARVIEPLGLLVASTLVLLATLPIPSRARNSVPEGSRAPPTVEERDGRGPWARTLGGFSVVFADRYLRLIAVFVVLLNCINSIFDFMFSTAAAQAATDRIARSPVPLDRATVLAEIFADYQVWSTLLQFLIQALLVSRVYRLVGVRGALFVLPVAAVLASGTLVLVPVFSLLWVMRIAQTAIDTSLMNTTRQALFLPTSRTAKYDGKMTIETFFWRFGDLLQAGIIGVGLNAFGLAPIDFAAVNLVLALAWTAFAWRIGREYQEQARINVINVEPEVRGCIPDLPCVPGQAIAHRIEDGVFFDADPGDVLTYRARMRGSDRLPEWLQFDPRTREFLGVPPPDFVEEVHIEVVASDVDGFEVTTSFTIRHAAWSTGSAAGGG